MTCASWHVQAWPHRSRTRGGRSRTVDRVEDPLDGASLDHVRPGAVDLRAAFARSHFSGRSGDLTVIYKPDWVDSETGTSHGTPFGYDARVPLFLFGKSIAPGEYPALASPTDIAPTLAFLAGITLPRADGRVLDEALTRAARVTHASSLPR